MAWVRWSDKDGPHPYESRIYVMDHVDGDLECVNCQRPEEYYVGKPADTHRAPDREAMAAHVQWHIHSGDAVPDFVIPSLLGTGPRWVDTTLAEMIEGCRKQGARIVSDDAEIPAEFRMSVMDLIQLAQEQGADMAAVQALFTGAVESEAEIADGN